MIYGPVLTECQPQAEPERLTPHGIETWQPAALGARELHVWELPLDIPAREVVSLFKVLAPAERQRAQGLRNDLVRRRFVVSRAGTRLILGSYLGMAPGDLRFLLGAQGKPGLPTSSNPTGLQFNLAHSGELGLLAVSEGRSVGIDVELMRPDWDYRELIGRILSRREVRDLDRLPAGRRREGFYAVWCRKEAYLKGLGLGMGDRMRGVEVSVDPRAPASLLRVGRKMGRPSRWTLLDVPVDGGYRACLAVQQAAAPAWRATFTASVLSTEIPLTMHVAS